MALQKAASMKDRARARYFRRRLFARMVEASHFGSTNVRASFEMESWHLSTRTRHFFLIVNGFTIYRYQCRPYGNYGKKPTGLLNTKS